jgi:arylsulfatase A-like enzyme/tetratricopeptide (TPR) repeat protein
VTPSAPAGASRRGGRLLSLVFAAAFLTAAACAKKESAFPGAPVILISVDTLRADHLPVYGYRLVETPAIDALAREALVFENAVSHVPLTLPSHASIFTGLLPFQNGVRDNIGYRLDPAHETLASFLSARGYATGAAISCVVLDRATGVGRGFDFYDDRIEGSEAGQAIGQVQRKGGESEKRLEGWIAAQPAGRPMFALLHLYEPHTPYEPPEPFRGRYPESRYDGEIAAADEVVGRFVGFLKARGLYDKSLVVFLSDHGEGLGEHGEDEHGILLYREAVHVPLFVKLPGRRRAGERVDAPAGLTDVFPTVARALGLEPPKGLPGASLLDLASRRVGARDVYSETLYPRFHFGWSDLASLTDDRHQYIQGRAAQLFDWREDPGEKRDLAGSLPPAFRRLRVVLAALSRPLQAPGAADPETVKKLASLGYLGQASPASEGKDLPDPKDRVGTLSSLKEAGRLSAAHRDVEAIALLRRFTAENPAMLDAWEALARALRRAGRPAEALAALERADRLAPGTPQIVMGMADLSVEARDFARARSLTEAARALGAQGIEEELAAIALVEGNAAEAERYAEEAHRLHPEDRLPLLLLARAESRQGRYEEALRHLDEALALEQRSQAAPMSGMRAARADALAHLEREKEAEEDFRREVRDFPDNLDAWSRLALLYASQGRRADVEALLSDMTKQVPAARGFEAAARVCEIVGDREGARRWRARAAAS